MDAFTVKLIKDTVDGIVKQTRLPAVGKLLQESGIATREQLRKLERMGELKCLPIVSEYPMNSVINGYYTEGELPNAVKRERVKPAEPAEEPSEVH